MKVAIACGGTGGHLFPGLAVAEVLKNRGHEVLLLISEKQIDAIAVGNRKEFRHPEDPRSWTHQAIFHAVFFVPGEVYEGIGQPACERIVRSSRTLFSAWADLPLLGRFLLAG